MHLANWRDRLTTFVDGQPVDVEERSGGRFGSSVSAAYPAWDELRAWASEIGAVGAPSAAVAAEKGWGAPSPAPRQVFGIGLNYRDHAEEAGLALPEFPSTFTKFARCIVGPEEPVGIGGPTSDWEVELVVVISGTARNVGVAEGWRHVAGLTIGQDLSERKLQWAGPSPQFNLGKSLPGYGPTGPWLVTPDELETPDDLALRCLLNGEEVQASRTAQLVFDVPTLISTLSSVVTLLPGDLIFTGTPGGVGAARKPPVYLQPGDVLTSEIEGIGTLSTSLVSKEEATAA